MDEPDFETTDGRHSSSPDDAFSFRIFLRPDSPIYAGHFPSYPITPGVALLTIVRELLERRLTMTRRTTTSAAASSFAEAASFPKPASLVLTSADDVKFLRPLTPDHNPVTVTFKEFQDNIVKAEITTTSAIHARMTLSYDGDTCYTA